MPARYAVARRYAQAIVNVTAKVGTGQNGAFRTDGRFLILGGGGAWIEMSGHYPIGSTIEVRFRLPPNHHIVCRAVVRNWVVRRGAGVEFLDLSENDLAKVVAFVKKQAGAQAPSISRRG